MKDRNGKSPLKAILTVLLVIMVVLLGTGLYLRKAGEKTSEPKRTMIAVDAGHDENYPGYSGEINENVYAQEVADRLCTLLDTETYLQPLAVKAADENMPVVMRSEKINASEAEAVVSIHCLYDDDTSKSGARIAIGRPDSEHYSEALKDAQDMQKALAVIDIDAEIGTYYYEPTKPDAYALVFVPVDDTTACEYETLDLISQCNVPVMQVELFYLSNPDDTAKMTTEEAYQETAQALLEGLRSSYGNAE